MIKENVLPDSEKMFHQFAERINEVFWVASSDWTQFIYISPAYDRTWGRSSEDLYSDPGSFIDFIFDEDRESVLDYVDKAARSDMAGIAFPQFRIVRPDNSLRWIHTKVFTITNGQGDPHYILGISKDITERKHAEKAFNAILESSVVITGQDFFNNIVRELSVWLDCEIAMVGEIINDNSVKAIAAIMDGEPSLCFSYNLQGTPCKEVIRNGFSVFPERVRERFPDTQILIDINAEGYVGTPLKTRDGRPIGVLIAMSRRSLNLPERVDQVMNFLAARASAEIERIRMEEDKKKIETQLHQASKLEAIGTLAGGIAHDFNNILQTIILSAELALLETDTKGACYYRMEDILGASRRATDLVKQILLFSRQGAVELQPLQINLIVKEAVKMLRSSLPATIDIKQDIDTGRELVMADPTRLQQIIMNLATNSAHAMREKGGTLTFALMPEDISEYKAGYYSGLKPGSYMKLMVNDTGHGIDPSIIDRIFDPFFTTKARGEGTGLGLAVTFGVVKDLGGAITVESEINKGSTFSVYLPRIEKRILQQTEEIKPLKKGKETILLVDDEKALIDACATAFARLGYQVVYRYSSMDALEAFRAQPGKFDLVITDQTMPRMTGIQLARELINIRPDIPVILCTGFSDLIVEEEAGVIGIKRFIMKPVVLSELTEVVRNVLDDV